MASISAVSVRPELKIDPSLTVEIKPTFFCCFSKKRKQPDTPVYLKSNNLCERFDTQKSLNVEADYQKTLNRIESHLKLIADHTHQPHQNVIRAARRQSVIPEKADQPLTIRDIRTVNNFANKWIEMHSASASNTPNLSVTFTNSEGEIHELDQL